MIPQETLPLLLLPEARFLQRLAESHAALAGEDEPPLWDRPAHSEWEDKRDDFTADCELLREDIASLLKVWEA